MAVALVTLTVAGSAEQISRATVADAARETGQATHSPYARVVCPPNSKPAGAGCIDLHPVSITIERCRSARRAVSYYRRLTWQRQDARGGEHADRTPAARGRSCHWAQLAADVWVARARDAREALARWQHDYAWWLWLPANWRALGACETGYGTPPGSWTWDSGRYVSFAGIYRDGYADDAHRIGHLSWDETIDRLGRYPTPREQYEAAVSHYRANGDGWGCPGP